MSRTNVVRQGKAPCGAPMTFLRDALERQSISCIEWPFALRDGYGAVKHEGKVHKASRIACIMAYGKPVTPRLEAAHLCGNPLCVNPRHLTWKTRAENTEDIAKHRSDTHFKLRRDQVIEIFIRATHGETSKHLAREFDITKRMVDLIRSGRRWGHVTQLHEKGSIAA